MPSRARRLGWVLLGVAALAGCNPIADNVSPHLDVDAGEDSTIEEGETVTLEAHVQGETAEITFRWDQQSGSEVPIAKPTNSETEVGPLDIQGDYKFRAVASTADGRFGQDFVTVTVEAPDEGNQNEDDNDNAQDNQNTEDETNDNAEEVDPDQIAVRINAPQRTPSGAGTPLIASQPAGGLEATYQWSVVAGDATIEDQTARETILAADSTGVVTVKVTMTVPEVDIVVEDQTSIIIEAEGAFSVYVIGPTEGMAGETMTLTAKQENTPVGVPMVHAWEVIQGEGEFGGDNARTPDFTPTSAGEVVVQVTVSGNETVMGIDDYVLLVFPQPVIRTEVRIVVEGLGQIPIELDVEASPITVANFLQYVDERHYDGQLFHRVISGFVIQAGGFTLDDSGEMIEVQATRDPIPTEADNGLSNLRGTVSVALPPDDVNAGDQGFFINLTDDNVFLDELQHTVFGRVTGGGMDVADAIAAFETDESDAPLEPVVITTIERVDQE